MCGGGGYRDCALEGRSGGRNHDKARFNDSFLEVPVEPKVRRNCLLIVG